MENISIEKVLEWDIDTKVGENIFHLLNESFSGYPQGRIFFRQQPSFRYLVSHKNILMGHCAIDSRCVYNGGELKKIFGLSDFCVSPKFQSTGVGRLLMEKIILDSRESQTEFILSFSGEHAFYEKLGFQKYDTLCRWLIISGDQSFGLVHRKLNDCLFVLPLKKDAVWDEAFTDLLGSAF